MAYSKGTNNAQPNAVVYDAKGNTVLPNGLRVLGLASAGFVKADAEGTFYIDISGGSGGGHVIKDSAGTSLPQQPSLKFSRLTVTNDSVNSLTLVTRPADSYVGLTAPSSPVVGDVWTSSETWKTYKYYDGYWVEYGTGSSTSTGGGGGGSGTVTSVSVVTANGFAGTVATSTSTPAITISTTVTGILKGNGTSISAAVLGTDYINSTNLTTDYDSAITGSRNSSNTTFTLSSNFVSGTTKVFVNGLRYTRGAGYDYTESSTNQIIFTNPPDSGDLLIVEYIKL